MQQVIDDMVDTMRDADGVGLAAPQVGVRWQLFVYEAATRTSPATRFRSTSWSTRCRAASRASWSTTGRVPLDPRPARAGAAPPGGARARIRP